ncbi:DUF1003 domain-containing protein [Sphingomonas sp. MA1305]|uniref:DUF1003 domain-containing protein n=1 Tax=Sphingomonas sp. MA1305 TaxID=2479204 RepID=UPI0018DFA81E|nr:DUF1003 domain-containing protein [Sphingomonas sp. MA1305]MBI0474601.1 DUF1003 domain-containing protein [Sphingomonas sp. MA1305]
MSDAGMTSTLQGNIARLTDRAARDRAAAPWSARLADRITRFTGSMTFVSLHLIVYGLWIVANLGWLPGVPRFDPTFVILASEASVEAIFLSTFVLISQNRMAAIADRRADLDLHINLLAEHELTRLATLVARIAERVGVAVDDPAFHEIQRDVAPEQVLDVIDAHSAATAAGSTVDRAGA